MPLKMEDRDIVQCIEAKIEIGHRARPRETPTKEGYTHDWTVYVRGQDRCDISQFVEKVVFHLHHTFSNPRRVVKKPPYYVSEVGYASFDLPIEIFFKSKKEPRKIMFTYDLFLQMYEPVSSVRFEKLTFQKPTDEFKEKLINAGGVLVLPPGETQSADLCGPPTKTESPKKQKQPLKSKENVSKQMLNFSGNEKSSNSGKDISASLKSSFKQEKIDNKSKDHDAALFRRTNSLPKMVSDPSPLPSRKRTSDSPIPSETKQKKARRSSSMSSEMVRSEDKQRFEEKENKDKVVKHKRNENKDDSQSKYKDGNDFHKMDTSKQTPRKNRKEKMKESNLKDNKVSKSDDKKEAKDDKKVVRDDKKELMDDNKDINDDTKDVKQDSKVNKDKKEEMDGKKAVQKDKIKVQSKKEVNNDKKEVIYDKKELNNDRKDVKDDRKGHKEVKDDTNGVKEVKDDKKIKEVKNDKQEVKAKKSSSSSEKRKHDDKRKGETQENNDKEEKSSECEYSSSKPSSKGESNKKETSSNRNIKSETIADAKKAKSGHRKRSGSPLSALDGSLVKKCQDSVKHLTTVTSIELKEDLYISSDSSSQSDDDFWGEIIGSDSDMNLDISPTSNTSNTLNPISSKSALKTLMDELEDTSADDEDDITDTVDVFSQHKSSAQNSPLVESGTASAAHSCKRNADKSYKAAISKNSSIIRKPTTPKDSKEISSTKSVSEKKSESSNISDVRKNIQNGIQLPTKAPSLVTKCKKDENKTSEEKSTSAIDSIFDEKIQTKTVEKNLDVKQKLNEERIKDRKEASTNENIMCNVVTEDISSSEQAPNGEELSKLEELKTTLMDLTDLSVLEKVVKLIQSTGHFEVKDTFAFDLCALDLNAIRQLQSFVATKT